MAGQLTSYSFDRVAVMVNSYPLAGFYEGDDVVQVNPNSDHAQALVGADGETTVSFSADKAATITLRMQPNSEGHAWLQRRYRQQQNGRRIPFAISVRDSANGEGGSAAEAVVLIAPQRSYGRSVQSRDWVIFAACWEPSNVDYEGA